MRLAIITSHPIQYNAPLFRKLAQLVELDLKVFYTWSQAEKTIYDPGFGNKRDWDIPLLEGYDYTFIDNKAKNPGSHNFWGIQNPSLCQEVESFQPDAILVYGWSFYSHLKLMQHYKGKIPIWFRGDSTLIDERSGSSVKKALRRVVLKWVYTHVDKSLYVGSANRKYYEAHGLKEANLLFAPHAVDNDRFQQDAEKQEAQAMQWRRELCIPDQAIVYLFVGKLEPKKNPLLLLDTFLTLNSDAYLIFAGDGPEAPMLKMKAAGNNKIIFLGFQNQSKMPIIYRLGNILVLPSQGPGETWGLVVNEAFACARPAIVSDKVGCAADLIQPDWTGWVFECNNENALMESLKSAIAYGKVGLQNLGNNAQALIQNWSYAESIAVIKQIIHHAD